MAPTLVLIAVLSIALPLAFIAILLRLVNRIPSSRRRAVRLPGAPDLEMTLDTGAGGRLDRGLDAHLDMAGLGQDTASRGPGRTQRRPMP